jgi:DNA-binding protein
MFVPQQPGRIIPADDVSAPAPVNANINISAIDAAGVEDVLINQRGNIISMIRDAANAQGNTFLEEVNVAEL